MRLPHCLQLPPPGRQKCRAEVLESSVRAPRSTSCGSHLDARGRCGTSSFPEGSLPGGSGPQAPALGAQRPLQETRAGSHPGTGNGAGFHSLPSCRSGFNSSSAGKEIKSFTALQNLPTDFLKTCAFRKAHKLKKKKISKINACFETLETRWHTLGKILQGFVQRLVCRYHPCRDSGTHQENSRCPGDSHGQDRAGSQAGDPQRSLTSAAEEAQ